jgi:hypothetical protein
VLARERPLQVLDLGSGAGSNVRYLSPFLPVPHQWLLVDRDRSLLAEASARPAPGHVATRCMELGALDDPDIFAGRHLVTASALLDLVSESWLGALADRCREGRSAVLFALTYNGRSSCTPIEPEDDAVRDLFNRHQKANDKGFGVAAGPDAVDIAARCFAAAGYRVRRESSDWVLPPEAGELQRQLIEGWAEAATETAPGERSMIQSWLGRRLAHIEANRSHIIVGHEDLAAWLPAGLATSFR